MNKKIQARISSRKNMARISGSLLAGALFFAATVGAQAARFARGLGWSVGGSRNPSRPKRPILPMPFATGATAVPSARA